MAPPPLFRHSTAFLLAACILATRAFADPIMWGSEGLGVEPAGMISVDEEANCLVGSADVQNFGTSDADNMVSLTFVAPAGYVLDVRYPGGTTGWFFSGVEQHPVFQEW